MIFTIKFRLVSNTLGLVSGGNARVGFRCILFSVFTLN